MTKCQKLIPHLKAINIKTHGWGEKETRYDKPSLYRPENFLNMNKNLKIKSKLGVV